MYIMIQFLLQRRTRQNFQLVSAQMQRTRVTAPGTVSLVSTPQRYMCEESYNSLFSYCNQLFMLHDSCIYLNLSIQGSKPFFFLNCKMPFYLVSVCVGGGWCQNTDTIVYSCVYYTGTCICILYWYMYL